MNFASRFRKSSNKSIDLFLARNPSLVTVGKLAISLEILKSEIASKFREEIDNPALDWYSYLFDRFTDTFLDKDKFTISDNKVSFITFNYDRSLEHFLIESLTYLILLELQGDVSLCRNPLHHRGLQVVVFQL